MADLEPALEEQRRVVTLLAADLIGSTALGESLDPEEVRLIVGGAVARMVTVAEGLGGMVKDLAGDGVFVLFGAPTAHEDDPERAVQAGLEIVDAVSAYGADVERGWGVGGVGVRVGISTGPVVVGPIGAGGRIEYGATGDAANTAARLQAAAERAMVLVDDSTYRLVQALFVWGEPRSLDLKGKSAPTLARAALARSASGSHRRRLDTPLVGRERELATARSALADVLAGAGGVLFVTGEPGIGKTRLIAELRREFASGVSVGGRPLWLEGQAASYSDTVPYAPFRHLLRQWLELPTAPPLRTRVALRRALEALFGGDAATVEPSLATLLGLELEDDLGEQPPQAVRRKAFEAMGVLLARLARDGPVAVALDDLQWADASSLELLEYLLGLPEREPVLLVLAQRVEREHGSWQLRESALRELPHRVRDLSLVPLPEESDAALLDAIAGRGTLPHELRSRLLAAARGNPFFLEELMHSLQDVGALVAGDGGWRLAREVEIAIPESVQNVVLARLDRLPQPSRALLTAASVLGRQFPLSLLEALTGADMDASLRELQRLDLVRETRRWPEHEFSFKHPLIQETAYRSLVRERRRELHARAAAAVVALFPDRVEEHAAVLAHHMLEAGRLEEALRHLRTAGDAAARVYATEEALDHYARAIGVAQEIGRDGSTLAELGLRRGQVAYRAGRLSSARVDYEDALAHARAEGLRNLELQALEEIGWWLLVGGARTRDAIARLEDALAIAHERQDDVASARIQSRLAVVHSHALGFAEADRYSRAALELARRLGDSSLLARALDSAKTVAVYLGDFSALCAIQDELGELLRRVDDSWYLQWAVFESALPFMAEGNWERAEEAIDEALNLNRRIGDRASEPYFVAVLGWVHRAAGDYRRALDLGRRAVDLATELDHRSSWIVWSETLLGWTLIELHAYAEAEEHLRRGLAGAEQSAAPLYVFRCAARLAEVQLGLGDAAGASATADQAQRLLDEMSTPTGRVFLHGADAILAVAEVRAHEGATECAAELVTPLVLAGKRSRWCEPVASGSRLLARLRLEAGDLEGAEEHLRCALVAAREGNLPGQQLRAHAALAELLLLRSATTEAARHHDAARHLAQQLADSIDEAAVRRSFLDGSLLPALQQQPSVSASRGEGSVMTPASSRSESACEPRISHHAMGM